MAQEIAALNDSTGQLEIVKSTNQFLQPYDLQLAIARGRVPGHSVVNIYGYNGLVGTSFVPLWEDSTTYTYPVSATTMLLHSTSSSDTNVTIVIQGLDTNYAPITETLVLTNGTTGVTTVNSFLRINSITTGDGVNAVGDIILGNAGKTITYAKILAGNGKSQTTIYTVPAGYTFYLTRVNGYSNEAGGSNNYVKYRVYTKNINGIVQVLLQAPFTSLYETIRVTPRAYTEKTDIQWQCAAAANTATIGIGIEGILISNSI